MTAEADDRDRVPGSTPGAGVPDDPAALRAALRRSDDELQAARREIAALRESEARHQLAESALRASEERFRGVAENNEAVFWVIDPVARRMLYISPAYERIWGRTCASLHAAPGSWLESIHEDDRARMGAAAASFASGNYEEIYRIVRPDGGERWIRDRAFPVCNAAGQVVRVIGAGATFSILLPAAAGAATAPGPAHEPTAARRGTETVLLVEDEEPVRRLSALVLGSAGYTVLPAADGGEAQRLAAAHPGRIDVLVTDMVMPGINGRSSPPSCASACPP